MKVGLSWDLNQDGNPGELWKTVLAEIEQADALGYDSAWISEGRDKKSSCPQPSIYLTNAAARTRCIQLVAASRTVGHASPIRIAEEVAVLDLYSRGRAGVGFLPGARQNVSPLHVHEMIEFVNTAWTADEFRYRGNFIRYPSDIGEEAPVGASEPEPNVAGDYVPQWEAGPVQPAFMTITPKPYQRRPMTYIEIDEDESLEWAARQGISPVVRADVNTEDAIERLALYRRRADEAGRDRAEVDPVLERRIDIGGSGDAQTLGGSPDELIKTIRQLKLAGSFRHLVWQRQAREDGQLFQFASEIQPLLQA